MRYKLFTHVRCLEMKMKSPANECKGYYHLLTRNLVFSVYQLKLRLNEIPKSKHKGYFSKVGLHSRDFLSNVKTSQKWYFK